MQLSAASCYFSPLRSEYYSQKPLRITFSFQGGADKSLARPGRKQATATKFGIYSTYSPRSSIHFVARCSKFCKPLKKTDNCLSNQVYAAAMTSASDKKMATFQLFFQSREQMVVRWGQIWRIGWVIKALETQVNQFLLGCNFPLSRGIVVQEQDRIDGFPAAFFSSKCPSISPAEMSNTLL